MTGASASSEGQRRAAWAVLTAALAAMLAFGAQAARHGGSVPPALTLPAAVGPIVAPFPSSTAAATAGATGTTALPPLPPLAAVLPDPGPVAVAARPFSLAGVAATDRARALDCLTAAVWYEAGGESDAGRAAVAQVVLNRVRHPAFPGTVCGVVYQGSDRAGCQFSFACDGSIQRRAPDAAGWARAARAAAAALRGRVYAPVGLATHYHSYAVTPAWNRALVMTDVVGAHFFHRWKGWWGTPAAFSRRYRGGEPSPGPLAPLPLPPPVIAAAAPVPVSPATTDRPGSGAPAAAADDRLPPAATILPQWRDSGRPLR